MQVEVGGSRVEERDSVRFLGVQIDRRLKWDDHIAAVTSKVRQLLGIIGRASGVLSGSSLVSLYNGMVLPHLQYCLMVWGDFGACGNQTRGAALLRAQKRFVGLMAGKRGLYHADPLFARSGVLKVGDLYRQQVRVHAWKFQNGRLPAVQAAMLQRVEARHGYGTRAARGGGLAVTTADHRSVGYRIPREWGSLGVDLREAPSVAAFKRASRGGFLGAYGAFECRDRGCRVCGGRA